MIKKMEVNNENDFFKGARFKKNLMLADEKDRSFLIFTIKKELKGEFFVFSKDQTFIDLLNELSQPSLFDENKIFIILDCEAYTKEQWEEVFRENCYLMFFFKNSAEKSLIEEFKKQGAILRLTEEKPWDRKNRLISEVIYTFHKIGVTISQGSAHRFVERTYLDLSLFHNELSKLKSYSYFKKTLTDKDIDEVVSPLPEENIFKVSEEIIWKKTFTKYFSIDNSSDVLQVIGAIRFQAYLGLKIAGNEKGKIASWQEKKYKEKALSLGVNFFQKILVKAFKAEERAKQSSMNASAIFDLLCLEIASFAK